MMTLRSIAALFGTMSILAMLPSASVFAVMARAIASEFTQGVVTAVGIVVGDFIFIILAISGLSAITETIDSLSILVKYFGGAYLMWLGISLWRVKSKTVEVEGIREPFWLANFYSGLLITLSDPKAIFFYMGFFPAFLDLSNISAIDLGIILAVTTLAVGGVKVAYAYMADRARLLFKNPQAKQTLNAIAGTMMIGTGIFLIFKN
jgi:threonine/homoserine/homoserine lactone efflux protein